MAQTLVKTEAGQREIRDRAVDLARSARTVLVLADGTRNREQLLAMVKGSTLQDIDALLKAGLVAEGAGAPAEADKPKPAKAAATAAAAPAAALGFKELYDCLTEMIREQMGVLKAFKYTLDVEKASTVEDLREVAQRFIDDVQKQKGDSAANMVRRALGMPG
jgi:hypothetical protein